MRVGRGRLGVGDVGSFAMECVDGAAIDCFVDVLLRMALEIQYSWLFCGAVRF